MKKLFTLCVLVFIAVTSLNAQSIGILKSTFGISSNVTARNVATDAQGNIYQIGYFNNTANFGNGVSVIANGSEDIYVVKYNSVGIAQWARRAGAAGQDRGYGITVYDTSVYITGNFQGTANFNTPNASGSNEISSIGSTDIFVAKYDNAGSFQWARRGGSNFQDVGYSIAANATSVYIAGQFGFTANFNTPSASGSNEITSAGNNDIFVAKYDNAGSFQWAKRAGGSSNNDLACGVAINGSSVYVTGIITGFVNFNTPSATSSNVINESGTGDIFIAKYNDTGDLQWVRRAGGANTDIGQSIAADATSVYITGYFQGKANFNTPSASGSNEITSVSNTQDIFLAKYDNAGNFQWAKRAGGADADIANGVAINGTSIFVTGQFQGTANFNTPNASGSNQITSAGGYDIFVAKYDDVGSFKWAKRAGGVNNDIGYGIATSGSSAYTVGSFSGTADFNTPSASGSNQITSSGTDAFLVEYVPCTPTTGWFTVTACNSYIWAAKGNKVYTASNNTDTIHLTNAGGCDSVVTLNLSVVNSLPAITGASAVCAGSTTTLSNAIAGGIWFTQATSQATIDATTGLVTGKNVGTITIQYSKTACGSTTKTFTVNAIPDVPSITYAPGTPSPQIGATTGGFCVGKTFSVVGTPNVPAGSWIATGFASITNGGVVSINAVGTGSIKYTYTDARGCSNSRIMSGTGYVCASRGVPISNDQLAIRNEFTMYPNPAKGFINLNIEKVIEAGSIVVTNLYGKSVKTKNLSMGFNTVNIANLSKGFYLVSVITSEGKTTMKLVVE